MWIICEGVDGSGKSTLVRLLSDYLESRAEVPLETHLGAPRDSTSALDECIVDEPFGSYRPGVSQSIVSDRLHWGCPVYGPVFRPEAGRDDGYGDFGIEGWRYAEMFVASRGGVTVYMNVPLETARRRVIARGEENGYSVDQILKALPTLIDRYKWLRGDSFTNVLWTSLSSVDAARKYVGVLVDQALRSQMQAEKLNSFPDYIGTPLPAVLYVCEPTREARLELLGELPNGSEWMTAGICSSSRRYEDLVTLHRLLEMPIVRGVGRLPSDAEKFVHELELGTKYRSRRLVPSGSIPTEDI